MKCCSLLLPALVFFGLFGCQSLRPVKEIPTEKKKPQPNSYWLNVRSHPVYGFDEKTFFKDLEIATQAQRDPSKIGVDLNGTWQQEGPVNIGGRINAITPLYRGSDTLFAGTPNGGIFRSVNGGQDWQPVFDEFSYLAIGAIAVDPSNVQTIYAGTGDRNFGGGSYNGNGLYKSTDLGETWSHVGLAQAGIISSVIVHPANPNVLLVGALGSGFAKTNDRGVFRSTDGGLTWQNTLFVSDSSGVCEMVMHPTDPNIVYACTFNRVNLYGNSIADGPDSKIFKSTDGGITWSQLTNGLPMVNNSRVGIAVAESNPNKLYAIYVSTDYNVYDIYVSSNAGTSWTALNAASGMNGLPLDVLGGFGWYFGRIHVNPFNENHLILPGVDQYASTDGGLNWTINVPAWLDYIVHADKHELIFEDAQTMIIGTDGGMYKTTDNGANWSELGQLPITQFYEVTASTFTDGMYAGGAQDNGTTSGNASNQWTRDFGGDGFKPTYLDPGINEAVFETQRGGIYYVSDVVGFESLVIPDAFPDDPVNWNAPYVAFSGGPIVSGTNKVIVCMSVPGDTWADVSPDLTRTALGATTPAAYHTISAIHANSFNQNEVVVGTSDGRVWKGNYVSGTWTDLTNGLPENYVTEVVYSKINNGKVYATMSGYYNNFNQALIFKRDPGAGNWTSITGDLPAIGINALVTYEISGNEVLFVGTDAGVYYSENDGVNWFAVGTNFPISTVSALDIDLDNNKLIAGTYGRSMWSYDLNWYVSIKESNVSEGIVYPNPVADKLVITEDFSTVKIMNAAGNVVWQKEGAISSIDINVSDWPKGMYLVLTDKQYYKFVKQ